MDTASIRAVANAVLYEGYILYPYRPSALKNRSQGWSFGTLLPEAYSRAHAGEPCAFHSEVLVIGGGEAKVGVEFRFLHLATPGSGSDALERSVLIGPVSLAGLGAQMATTAFAFPNDVGSGEPLTVPLRGSARVSAATIDEKLTKLTVSIRNETPSGFWPGRNHALQQALVSAHALLTIDGGAFVSLLDPPEEFREQAHSCSQNGVFPVLAGEEGERSAMLLSPIILYDYPRIATNSAGEFFDSSEIDEMLTLRVLTLTDEEKHEVRQSCDRARAILQRTESLSPDDMLKLHGVVQRQGSRQGVAHE